MLVIKYATSKAPRSKRSIFYIIKHGDCSLSLILSNRQCLCHISSVCVRFLLLVTNSISNRTSQNKYFGLWNCLFRLNFSRFLTALRDIRIIGIIHFINHKYHHQFNIILPLHNICVVCACSVIE